jgi:hypothetical protein
MKMKREKRNGSKENRNDGATFSEDGPPSPFHPVHPVHLVHFFIEN